MLGRENCSACLEGDENTQGMEGYGVCKRAPHSKETGLTPFAGKKTSTAPAKEEKPAHVEKTIGGKANGEKRLIPTSKASKYYPGEDVRRPKASRKVAGKTQLRQSITPGTVLILLSGRFAGKRVVFLKQLDSGLLLVSGPFKWVSSRSSTGV